jgi:glycosyltransferase involved in cell wall biosynthesis
MSKILTIIVPVYNGERFIGDCLTSLVNQATRDVEIIVVNDGSTDGTERIVQAEFRRDLDSGDLTCLSVPNAGVSVARNLGLDRASGEYVAFVDADDIVAANYVATVLAATAESPDIIEFGYGSIDEHGTTLKDRCFVHTRFGRHARGEVLDTVFAACLWYPFLRAFRRELFHEVRFPAGVRFCEDVIAVSAVYKRAGTIVTLPNVLYHYRINPTGATLNAKPDYATNLIDYYRRIADDQSFANKALKIGLGYTIRGCIAKTTDPLGRMPPDIEADIRTLAFTPSLLYHVRGRLLAYAICGPILYFVKRLVR